MSVICYELSNQQRKDLLVRGTPIRLALPCPPHDIGHPVEWARMMLPTDVRELVTAAEETEVCVNPLIRGTEDLTGLLGKITKYNRDVPEWLVSVAAVIVTLSPRNPRNKMNANVAWPKQVRFPRHRDSVRSQLGNLRDGEFEEFPNSPFQHSSNAVQVARCFRR